MKISFGFLMLVCVIQMDKCESNGVKNTDIIQTQSDYFISRFSSLIDSHTDRMTQNFKTIIQSLKNWQKSIFANVTQSLYKFEDMLHPLDDEIQSAEINSGYDATCVRKLKNERYLIHERAGSDLTTCISYMLPQINHDVENFNSFTSEWGDMTTAFQLIMTTDLLEHNPVTKYNELAYEIWPESYYKTMGIVEYDYIVDSRKYYNNLVNDISMLLWEMNRCFDDATNQLRNSINNVSDGFNKC